MVSNLDKLPQDVRDASVAVVCDLFCEHGEAAEGIREAIALDPENWFIPYHFGWGMEMRNYLRNNVVVVRDGQELRSTELEMTFPSIDGNYVGWDDYYVEVVEAALGGSA